MKFKEMTLLQLKAYAKEKGIRGVSTLKKDQLIEKLIASENKSIQAKTEVGIKSEEGVNEGNIRSQEKGKQGEHTRKTQQKSSESEKKEKTHRHINRINNKNGKRNSRENFKEMDEEHFTEKKKNFDNETNENSINVEINAENYPKTAEHIDEYENDKENVNNLNSENTGKENKKGDLSNLDSGNMANGILEVMPDGYGFIRCENYLPGENDVYVSPSQIRRFNLKTGDILVGNIRIKTQNEKYSALLYVQSVNGYKPFDAAKRKNFEDLTPIFPNERISLETENAPLSMRMVDLLSPIGKGQRGMIVSQPKTGKTTLLKQIARSITATRPNMKVIVLLIDERPEEVTDIRESIEGPNAEVIYSTFDELPEHHKRVSEMVLERAKRLVEHKQDVVILLDSITRLARAYNLLVPPSGRTLSGGLDPAALYMPKKFFGAARNMREGGSLTILATALVETGSKMDDVVFEEFKGTGNMELVLDRKLAEKRIFPAINIQRSGTRRDDLLLSKEEQEIVFALHREMSGNRAEENMEQILNFFKRTKNNKEFIRVMKQSLLKK
nr:transcription termination factor Rho [uncultured Anaerobutyricum sp.]